MFFRRKNIRPYEKASVIGERRFWAPKGEQNQGGPGRPGPPEAYLSPFFVPFGDLEVPEGFSKNDDTLWVDGVKYWDGEGKVTLSLSNKIIPYLTLLHTQLTSYDLKQISNLKSSYAIRFYELMVQFRSTGERWMKLDILKERLELQDQYPRFFDLKKRIIDPAITEINNSTNLTVKWNTVKKGRLITALEFYIQENK